MNFTQFLSIPTVEYLGQKAAACTPDTMRTILATLRKLQEGLHADVLRVKRLARELLDTLKAEWLVLPQVA